MVAVARAHAGDEATLVDLAGALSLGELGALVARAALLLGNNSGPVHVAAALGTPVVGIYGPTRPARNGPWGRDHVIVSRADVCRCHHLRRCRAERMCLLDISVSEVVDAVERRLAASAR
jgi:ADP-heptose:LPS heptosyltransferase